MSAKTISVPLKKMEKPNDTVLPNNYQAQDTRAHMSDLDLIAHYQATADMDNIVVLMERHERYIVGVAIRMINHPEEIKDIKQELFFKLMDKLQREKFNSATHFRKWIGRVTKNYIYDKYIRPKHPVATDQLPEKLVEVLPQMNLELDFERVKACIEDLKPDQRIYIELKYFGNMENQEISTHMNWPYNKTRGAGDRALRNLKKRLTDAGGEFAQYFKDE